MITGVVLHGFGRLALAKVYVKTEAVINEAAAHAAPASNAHGSSGRYGGALGAEGSGGVGEGRGERKMGDVPYQPEESSRLLRLNGVSSSIGEMQTKRLDTSSPGFSNRLACVRHSLLETAGFHCMACCRHPAFKLESQGKEIYVSSLSSTWVLSRNPKPGCLLPYPPLSCRSSCLSAAGVGWGLIHAVIMVGTALSKHMGPGAAFSPSCPHVPSVIVSGESDRRPSMFPHTKN